MKQDEHLLNICRTVVNESVETIVEPHIDNVIKTIFTEGYADKLDIATIIQNQDIPYSIEDDTITITTDYTKTLSLIVEFDEYYKDYVDYMIFYEGEELSLEDLMTFDEHGDDKFTMVISLYNAEYENNELPDDAEINEAKRVIKVNSKGQRRIKMQCKKGFKFTNGKCVQITGKERINRKLAIRKAVKTKKAKGSGFLKNMIKKRNKALKKRKSMVG